MKYVNVDEVLKILHKYGEHVFVNDMKRYQDMTDKIANLKGLKLEDIKVDVESMVSALEREEYAEGCGGYVIPAYKVYAILHKYIKENGDGK